MSKNLSLTLFAPLLIVAINLILPACSTDPTVTRTPTDTITDLSGRWNDTDSRLTAETMIASMLNSAWLPNFSSENERQPVVIIGRIRNRSSEHIDSQTFINLIEKELVNNGQVILVAGGEMRTELRVEREDQQSNASAETASALAAETGADFMLQGVITSQTDAIESKRATLYMVDMELINLQSNQKTWIDTKEIKKIIERKKNKW